MNTARKMGARLTAVAAATLTALYVGITAPAQPAAAATFAPITGAGSTWSYPAIHAWIDNLNQQGMTINYQPNGSNTGRAFFAGGQADWAASEILTGCRTAPTLTSRRAAASPTCRTRPAAWRSCTT